MPNIWYFIINFLVNPKYFNKMIFVHLFLLNSNFIAFSDFWDNWNELKYMRDVSWMVESFFNRLKMVTNVESVAYEEEWSVSL